MEASQASEAGSIPVARSTTARLHAGRLCCASATGTPGQPRTLLPSTRALTQPCGRAPGTKLPQHAALAGRTGTKLPQLAAQRATPVQNSPSTPKMAHFSTFYASRENFIPLPPPTGRAGRTLYRTRGRCRYKTLPARSPAGNTGTKLSQHARNIPFRHVLRQQGEFYTASTTNRSSRAKKVTHQHPTSPTNAPLPQFRMQFDCVNFQQSPETLQFQRCEFKI